jgi:hypothetical protein
MPAPKVTLFIGAIVAIMLTICILWATNTTDIKAAAISQEFEFVEVEVEPEESIWGKMIPKSMAEKRNDRRLALQTELTSLIEGISGITEAQVVLSLQESKGLGHRYVPSTACVTITPSANARLTSKEIETVTRLISGGATGVLQEDVTVVDNRDGLICTGNDLPIAPLKLNQETIRIAVEEALGLNVATVKVEMVSPYEGEMFIPWMDNKRPVVRLTLPRSWVTWRASQVGDVKTVTDNISHIAQSSAAGSLVEISIIPDSAVLVDASKIMESSAKQWAMVFGLSALLLSGLTVRRRKREVAPSPRRSMKVSEEAAFILSLSYQDARVEIDALHGTRRRAILESITGSEVIPIVEFPARVLEPSELAQCV